MTDSSSLGAQHWNQVLDALLLRLARTDAEQDWARFITSEGDWLSSVIRSRLGADDQVEDCLQNALMQIRRRLTTYTSDPLRVRAWLKTVVTNVAQNMRQAETARSRRERIYASESQRLERVSNTSHLGDDARLAAARRALLDLPENQRRVVELRYFYGLSTRQVAVELAQRTEATKRTLSRALATLRRRLKVGSGPAGLLLLLGDLSAAAEGLPGLTAATGASGASVSCYAGKKVVLTAFVALLALIISAVLGIVLLQQPHEKVHLGDEPLSAYTGEPGRAPLSPWRLQWQREIGGPGVDIGQAVAIGKDGQIYAATLMTVNDVNSDASRRSKRVISLSSYDAQGELLWQKPIRPGLAAMLMSDRQGGVYLAGTASLCRINAKGEEIWQQDLSSISPALKINDLSVSHDAAAVFLYCHIGGKRSRHSQCLLLKHDAHGVESWRRSIDQHQAMLQRFVSRALCRSDGSTLICNNVLKDVDSKMRMPALSILDKQGKLQHQWTMQAGASSIQNLALHGEDDVIAHAGEFITCWTCRNNSAKLRWQHKIEELDGSSEMVVTSDGIVHFLSDQLLSLRPHDQQLMVSKLPFSHLKSVSSAYSTRRVNDLTVTEDDVLIALVTVEHDQLGKQAILATFTRHAAQAGSETSRTNP